MSHARFDAEAARDRRPDEQVGRDPFGPAGLIEPSARQSEDAPVPIRKIDIGGGPADNLRAAASLAIVTDVDMAPGSFRSRIRRSHIAAGP